MMADIPEMLRYWDYEKNERDPAKVAAQSNTEAFWMCEAHLAGDPERPVARASSRVDASGRRSGQRQRLLSLLRSR